jgi:hypothetical protein
MIIHRAHKSLTFIAILAALTLLMTSSIVSPALAIKRFFNCMTDIANKHGKLTVDDVNTCYDKEYHTGSYASHNHSTSTSSGSGGDGGSSASGNK